jgi:hypothetical protein
VNDRERLEHYVTELTAEISAMKAVVTRALPVLRTQAQAPPLINAAFRRVIELGPQLVRLRERLAAIGNDNASPLRLRRHGSGYVVDGLPLMWAAQLVRERDLWLMILKRQDERVWSYRFVTPFDALAALQSEIDPTLCIIREDVVPSSAPPR